MHLESLLLLCLGLCLGYGEEKRHETLPKPLFRAWPSSVVESRSNVTLTCRSPFRNATFWLGKLNSTGQEQQLSPVGKDAELLLTDLQPEDAGQYFCAYKTADSQGWSKREHLHLVVTGGYERPETERPETERPETLPREIGEHEALDIPSSKPGSKRLIFVTVFTCISIVLLFIFIFLIYRCTQHDSAPGESTERTSCAQVPDDQEAPESADLGSDLEPR
ncbi:V-set and transmembrane domain-containing protein 1-like isoform X4 [Tenrec ecaudatus]|uniref:V-set and transmembrane domain-containing protein 1-like isoform X4 n=1 Tax=Tenrec ecaudatus TaxID=94439 RepID=UPI003F5A8F97